ncbi:Tabersonine 16-O-methyltransferase [Capsicum baccatum]|uniref:Tabersonine 16-O-methyltransferase n=1 Tax=Capsicum baccatum TaxID=33114 RepID=A0A2G2XPY6_CAPBA|nr:Tabersonine 16-O-methyltransferase [Capsicum baccatum]
MTLVARGHFFFTQHLVVLKTTASVSDWLQNNLPIAFETAHGKSYWDYFAKESEFGSVFDDAMASDSSLISNLLISDCYSHVFEGLTSLVDIGAMAMAIVESFPSLKCIVLDLSHVIGDLKGTRNLEFVIESMFDKIPRANAILLKVPVMGYLVVLRDYEHRVASEVKTRGITNAVPKPKNMPLKSTQERGMGDQSASQPIYPDPLGKHFSHAEFRAAFTILPHSVKS